MKKIAVLTFGLLLLSAFFSAGGCSGSGNGTSAPPQAKSSSGTGSGGTGSGGTGKLTFLELGSVGCKPCEAMVPVLDSVREKYGSQVEVVFHNVRKEPEIAMKWRVTLIPTQVFLDREGKEYFRHEGFFPLEEVEKALKKGGLR